MTTCFLEISIWNTNCAVLSWDVERQGCHSGKSEGSVQRVRNAGLLPTEPFVLIVKASIFYVPIDHTLNGNVNPWTILLSSIEGYNRASDMKLMVSLDDACVNVDQSARSRLSKNFSTLAIQWDLIHSLLYQMSSHIVCQKSGSQKANVCSLRERRLCSALFSW